MMNPLQGSVPAPTLFFYYFKPMQFNRCMGFFFASEMLHKCVIRATLVRPKEFGKLSYWDQKTEVI